MGGVFLRGRPDYSDEPPALLRILPTIPASLTGAGTLSGSKGEVCTFTRVGAKHCLKSDGTYTSLGTNLPAVEPLGLLMEDAATNLILRSGAMANVAWTPTNLTATADIATAPDGTATGARYALNSTTGGSVDSLVYQGVNVTAAAHTASVWLKGAPGFSGTVYLFFQDSASAYFSTACAYVDSEWRRFTLTFTPASGLGYLIIGVRKTVSGQSGQPAATVYAWGAQLEARAFATSYIATAGTSATRNKDRAIFPALAAVAAGSIELQFTPQWSTPPSQCYLVNTCSALARSGVIGFINTDGALYLQTLNAAGAAGQADVAAGPNRTWVAGQTYRIRFEWGAGNLYIYRNGVVIASSTTGSAVMPDAANTINLGTAYNGNNPCFGHLSKIVFR
jgi:hypothetical protein